MDIQFTINSHDENRQGEGKKSPKIKLGMKIMQISEQTTTGKEVFKIKLPSDLQL